MNSTKFAKMKKRANENRINWEEINKEKYYGDWHFLMEQDGYIVYMTYIKNGLPEIIGIGIL